MNNRFIINFMILASLIMIFKPVFAQDELTITSGTVDWNIPQISCDENLCPTVSNVDRNGVLYINSVEEERLYVVNPDGSSPKSLDLSEVTQSVSTARFGGLVAFEDGIIIFDGYSVHGYQLFLYDSHLNQATPLNISWQGRPTECEYRIMLPWRKFYRLGTDKRIVVCSISDDGFYRINIVNVATLSLERTISSQQKAYPDARPWMKLQGGDDGNLYIQLPPGVSNFLAQDQTYSIAPEMLFYVARYNPVADTWSSIPIPKQLVSRAPLENTLNSIDTALFGVDELGNLYFSIIWSNMGKSLHVDLFKLDSVGNVIWHLTEDDIGGVKYFRSLIQSDIFFVTSVSGDEIIEVQNPSSLENP